MIGCSMVEPVRSDQQAQEEVEKENMYSFIYTTGASEHQLPFRMDGVAAGDEGPRKKQFHILLVFWPVYCGTSTDTYLDMHRWLCLVDEPKSGAIFWNYFLP